MIYRISCFFLFLLLFLTASIAAYGDDRYTLTVIHTNDEHSSLVPSLYIDYTSGDTEAAVGGYARLAGFIQEVRNQKAKENEPVLVFSAGDFLGGTPFAWLSLEGLAPEVSIMQNIGYDAAVIGNHEYDYGPELLASYLMKAGYPEAHKKTALLASNTHTPKGHILEEIQLKDNIIMKLENGLTVGVFGLIGKDAVQVAPLSKPVVFSDQIESAKEQVSILKEEGADIIILLSHSGVDEERAIAQAVPGIHLIIGGHCHTLLEEPIIEGNTIIAQAGSLLQYAGILELSYRREDTFLTLQNMETGTPFVQKLDSSVPVDTKIQQKVEAYTDSLNALIQDMTDHRFSAMGKPLAGSDFPLPNRPRLQETPFGNFVTDAMRIIGEKVTGAPVDASFQANGLLRGSLTPGKGGAVSVYDLVSLVGLGSGPDGKPGYPLVSFYLTGSDLRKALEISVLLSELLGDTYFLQTSGLRKRYDPNRAVLFTLPIADIPLPTSRAVLDAERFTGRGIQTTEDKDYIPLSRKDDTLYHVISDYYLIPFLPMVGELVPQLAVTLRNRHGDPVKAPEDTIVYTNGKEVKVWETVVAYAASFPQEVSSHPIIPEVYRVEAPQRLVSVNTIPLILYPLAILIIIGAGLAYGIRKRAVRKRNRQAGSA